MGQLEQFEPFGSWVGCKKAPHLIRDGGLLIRRLLAYSTQRQHALHDCFQRRNLWCRRPLLRMQRPKQRPRFWFVEYALPQLALLAGNISGVARVDEVLQ